MILISETYQVVTEESARDGDFAEQGFTREDEPVTFRELVNLLRECSEVSQSPLKANEVSPYVWASTYPDTDYSTAEETTRCFHYSRKNPARNAKYWRMAFVAAGLTR